jgi:uncharacterized membrane protein YfcA
MSPEVAIACLVLIGLIAGCLGGLLGVGGSIVMIPAMMLLLGPDLHVYQGAAMIVNFFVVVPATLQHIRHKAVVPSIVRATIPSAAVTVLLGVQLSQSRWLSGANEIHLSRIFGLFLWYEAAYNLWRMLPRPPRPNTPALNPDAAAGEAFSFWRVVATVGFPTGFIGGLLGVGGGILAVPCQQLFLGLPLRKAIANSAATIICVSAIGATFKNYHLAHDGVALARPIGLAAILIPTAVLGAHAGARLTHVVPLRLLRLLLAVLMAYAGWKMIDRQAKIEPGRPAAASAAVRQAPWLA